MHRHLDPETLLARVKDFNYNATVQTASLVMSGLIALAGIQLIEIVKSQDDVAIRLLLWTHTLVNAVFFLRYQLHSQLATTPHWPYDGPTFLSIFGVLQVATFVLLAPIPGIAQSWKWWFVGHATFSWLGAAVMMDVFFRLNPTRLSTLYGAELTALVPLTRGDVVADTAGSTIAAVAASIAGAVAWFAAGSGWITWFILGFVALSQVPIFVVFARKGRLTLALEEIAMAAIEKRATGPELGG